MEFEYSYRFTEKAVQDLDEILRYISVELANHIAAQKFGRKIFEKIDIIRTFPKLGAPVDNDFLSDKTLRKLPVDNYFIFYKLHYDERIVSIVRIIYGKRNIDEILKNNMM